ncbi:MAG: hypothetical protein DMF78_15380 [Acidobacteria bacterium]|nr:MAG: hypothetical protein DMF78_15380 [Acidobacteriota bacterium]
MGVHARPRHHDHRHQSRTGRRAAVRPRRAAAGPGLARPGRRRPVQPRHPRDGGVVVTGVVDGGPADRAGVTRGDLVLSLDGAPVSSLRELYTALWKRRPGETVGLQVLRDSAIRVVEITAGDRDEFYK